MKHLDPSFAMRKVRQDLSQPVTWTALIGVGLVLALAGAFGTSTILRPVPLAAYWIVIAILTYSAGAFVAAIMERLTADQPQVLRVLLNGLATGIVICGLVLGLNIAIFGVFLEDISEWLSFGGSIFGVTFIIAAVVDVVATQIREPLNAAKTPALLDRLPPEIRGPLVSISVEDHYVRVRTTKGEDMILMRLGDAIREAGDGGFQVHRSHWVASGAVTSASRTGDRAMLTLSHGSDIPVSRRYLPDVRAAGLFDLPESRDG